MEDITTYLPCRTLNSSLVPTKFDQPRGRQDNLRILEPRGGRRPKSGDHKLLAAYVAAYTGTLIPDSEYRKFISPQGEREWKRMIRVACDKEWRAGETRRFDEISQPDFEAMSYDVRRAWPLTKYFDGNWIIKWAMRITWTNRTKSARRRDKRIYRQQRREDRQSTLSDDDALLAGTQARRRRASRLGESLYCIGGCQRLLQLEHFPVAHVGRCKACNIRRERSEQLDNEPLSHEEPHQSTHQQRRDQTDTAQAYVPGESSNSHRRKNPHALLPRSVTTYSDFGAHPSDRSTFGVSKPKRAKKQPPGPARDGDTGGLPRSSATHGVVSQVDTPPGEVHILPVRARTRARSQAAPSRYPQPTGEDESTAEGSEDGGQQPGQTYQANSAVLRVTEQIKQAWGVTDISEVFPKEIWPKLNTEWRVNILERFLDLAKQYPDKKSRIGITAKFKELCHIRRKMPNAKTQWTTADTRSTEVWAKEHCTPFSTSSQSDRGQGTVQQQRKPGLLQAMHKGKQKAGQGKEASVRKNTKRSVYNIPDDGY